MALFSLKDLIDTVKEKRAMRTKVVNPKDQPIPVQLTGSVVKYRNIDRIALEPAETIRVVDNERKLLPNVYIYFKTAPNASNIKVSIHSRINPGWRYVNTISTQINDSGLYKKIYFKNVDVINLYTVEFTNLSDSPIEIYDILIVEEL